MANDPSELPFDPVRIRLKIHELRKNLHGLEALLETYGLGPDGPKHGELPLSDQQQRRRATTRQQRRVIRRTGSRRARASATKKPKLADLAVEIISKHGGRAHGKVIVEELRRAGHMANVVHPDSNISTALSRDPRVERASDARNTWVLKKA